MPKILIVEDDIDLADTLLIPLEMMNHSVKVTYDGYSAIEATREQTPQGRWQRGQQTPLGLPLQDGRERVAHGGPVEGTPSA